MKRSVPAVFILLLCAVGSLRADHSPEAQWSWHVHSAGGDESRLVVYQRDRHFAIYNLACDLGEAVDGEVGDDSATIGLVELESVSSSLLVVSCNVGAHGQQISVFDLERKSTQPVFSATGSYSASWEIRDGEFWVSYDEPCDTGPSVECPDGYVTIFEQYPPAPVDN